MRPCSQISMWSYEAKQVRGSEGYDVTDLIIHTGNALGKYAPLAPPGLHVSMQITTCAKYKKRWQDGRFFSPNKSWTNQVPSTQHTEICKVYELPPL